MSDDRKPAGGVDQTQEHGPNLVLIYTLMALALAAAIAVAAMIVFPFWHRR